MFLPGPSRLLTKRLQSLQEHLKVENPLLLSVVSNYLRLDRILYRMGLLSRNESLTTRIPWWPLISVLGTFSSGKSTFINTYIGEALQDTGNQAVDDKFTVICYGIGSNKVLPGTALDADPRLPFYRISEALEKVAPGEGRKVDSYLQLKTTSKLSHRGRIIIDSPGFDADDQRRSILRLTRYIIDLSDLVLIFFDARHPEPGAMQDTLHHLVSQTILRSDASKFLYILNQIDTTVQEDNPEQVVGAWQRAIAQAGLISGRFYCVYNQKVEITTSNYSLRERFESKRDRDLAEIYTRMSEVEVQRRYRIVNILESVINEIEQAMVPTLKTALQRWRTLTLVGDTAWIILWCGLAFTASFFDIADPFELKQSFEFADYISLTIGAILLTIVISGHITIKGWAAHYVATQLPERAGSFELGLRSAFIRSTKFTRLIFQMNPSGWGKYTKKQLQNLRHSVAIHIQNLNDIYTDPSGHRSNSEENDAKKSGELEPSLSSIIPQSNTGTLGD